MNRKIRFIASALCLILSSACVGTIFEPGGREVPADVPCEEADAYYAQQQQLKAGETARTTPDQQNRYPANVREQNENDFVNYTETAANYREYGERSQRDQFISTAGAGGSISAAIPPSVEEEIGDYEEDISSLENNEGGSGGDSATAEDPVEDWLAEEGKNLRTLLTEWSDKAGWRLVWKTNRNYTLTAGAMFRGRFADVSSALIRAFGRARPAPIGTFYKGNRVLVVETLEDENAYE